MRTRTAFEVAGLMAVGACLLVVGYFAGFGHRREKFAELEQQYSASLRQVEAVAAGYDVILKLDYCPQCKARMLAELETQLEDRDVR